MAYQQVSMLGLKTSGLCSQHHCHETSSTPLAICEDTRALNSDQNNPEHIVQDSSSTAHIYLDKILITDISSQNHTTTTYVCYFTRESFTMLLYCMQLSCSTAHCGIAHICSTYRCLKQQLPSYMDTVTVAESSNSR